MSVKERLAIIARDGLLAHLQRGDARHAVRLMVSAAAQALGRAVRLDSVDLQGRA
jgi:hypothetical protein